MQLQAEQFREQSIMINDLKRRGIVILAKIASLYHFTILTCVSSISLYLCHSDQTTCFASTQIDKPFSQA